MESSTNLTRFLLSGGLSKYCHVSTIKVVNGMAAINPANEESFLPIRTQEIIIRFEMMSLAMNGM